LYLNKDMGSLLNYVLVQVMDFVELKFVDVKAFNVIFLKKIIDVNGLAALVDQIHHLDESLLDSFLFFFLNSALRPNQTFLISGGH
jgi:hypothetical protein